MSKTCFLIAPIGRPDSESRGRIDFLWESVLVPTLQDYGYSAVRADFIAHPGLIVNQILNQLTTADLVVADLSDSNPNVFYELGIRHATGLPVIHITENGNSIPFDLQAFKTIFYEVTPSGAINLEHSLRSFIEAIEESPDVYESVVNIASRLGAEKDNQKLAIRAYLSEKDPEKIKEIAEAIQKLKSALDLEVVDDPPPILNSWWKYWGTKTVSAVSQPEVAERLRKAERALEMHTLHKAQSEVDKNQAEAASAVLKSLEKITSAAIQVGSLLIIKTTNQEGASIAVRTLTQDQLAMLEKNPSLLKSPADILIQLEQENNVGELTEIKHRHNNAINSDS